MLKRSKSHYSAFLARPAGYHELRGPARKEADEIHIAQGKSLRDLGWREKYFEFRDGDAKGKANAKAQAEAHAAQWAEKTGFKFHVSEGFFMSF